MIHYTLTQTPYGSMLLAVQTGKIVGLAFGDDSHLPDMLKDLFKDSPTCPNDDLLQPYLNKLMQGKISQSDLHQTGTDLQKIVWDHLLQIPKGTTLSYSELARRIGRPKAVRAVANAVGRNKISLLIPCHRVIGKNASLGGYRWGISVKKRLLEMEKIDL